MVGPLHQSPVRSVLAKVKRAVRHLEESAGSRDDHCCCVRMLQQSMLLIRVQQDHSAAGARLSSRRLQNLQKSQGFERKLFENN